MKDKRKVNGTQIGDYLIRFIHAKRVSIRKKGGGNRVKWSTEKLKRAITRYEGDDQARKLDMGLTVKQWLKVLTAALTAIFCFLEMQ